MAIRDILFDLAPEFETVDAAKLARVERFIGYAAEEIHRAAWGAKAKADRATALLAGHMLTISARRGSNQGALTGERVGDLGRTYAPPSGGREGGGKNAEYQTTSYGVEFVRLRASIFKGGVVL